MRQNPHTAVGLDHGSTIKTRPPTDKRYCNRVILVYTTVGEVMEDTCLVGGMRHLVRHASPQSPDRHSVPLHVVEQLALLGHGVSGFHPPDDNLPFRRVTIDDIVHLVIVGIDGDDGAVWWLLLLLSLMSDGRFRLHERTILSFNTTKIDDKHHDHDPNKNHPRGRERKKRQQDDCQRKNPVCACVL